MTSDLRIENEQNNLLLWGLFGLTAVTATLIRLVALGTTPLSPSEAEAAWGVWQFWQANPETVPISSPAYFSLTAVLTQIFGFSDGLMRLVPALFGIGVALLPWLWREKLGLAGTFIASLLLAVSPTQAISSRTVGGDSIALFALLLIVTAVIRYQAQGQKEWLYWLGGGVGLGLASSPLFYGGALTLLIAGGYRFWRTQTADSKLWRETAVVAFAVFLAVSSLFLWHLPGIGATSRLLGDWLAQFALGGGNPPLALLRYEGWLVFLTLFSILFVITGEGGLGRQLSVWTAVLILLMLVQSHTIVNVALFTLPGALLIGLMAHEVLDAPIERHGWLTAGVMLTLLMVTFVNLARYTRVTLSGGADISLWVGLMSLIGLIFVVYFMATWDVTAVAQALLLAIIGLLLFYQTGTAWHVSHTAANDPRERWVTTATDDSIHTLHRLLTDISRQKSNSESDLTIVSSVNSPVLGWYLRDFNRLTMGESLPLDTQSMVLISGEDGGNAPLSNYIGTDLPLIRQQPIIPANGRFVDLLRWWLLRESTAVYEQESIIIWQRME